MHYVCFYESMCVCVYVCVYVSKLVSIYISIYICRCNNRHELLTLGVHAQRWLQQLSCVYVCVCVISFLPPHASRRRNISTYGFIGFHEEYLIVTI